jgi:membrane protease YdiL (CAAX protease family)
MNNNDYNNSEDNIGIRLLEWALVIIFAIVPSSISSVYIYFYGSSKSSTVAGNEIILGGIIFELMSIGLLGFVLSKQNKSLKDILITFKWADIPISIVLTVLSYFIFNSGIFIFNKLFIIINGQGYVSPEFNNPYVQSGLTIFAILLVVINPFYEELIIRAYTIPELLYFTDSKFIAVAISVIIQTLCHLYQGGDATFALFLTFILDSAYYVQTKRIWPIILSHLFFDVRALFYFS